ncbi:hypothetical protein TraAM80_02255 [Trypanosoma rangeli]|uniref:Uncharacterized protein n=1 Tax=Trypanosoma rangeli TaxID=5698 RepID=A0A3R7L7Q9_TRYRA|nr:uncharacterized protein TraAM80_02255 [Trypanosoma rangeli]RNF09308.1 hypothetical protein TraAM80_02255 [Trypanosoma rangeli]|eukprot:RNF09308.1 hypothetical protein TraAM80_02255 [Trypanosoma rangeli]
MRRGSPRLTPEGTALLPRGSKGPALILMALFFAHLTTPLLSGPSDELSTTITSSPGPTLLQQLASFAAMREVAEEEHLDWGAPAAFSRQKTFRLQVQPREGCVEHHNRDTPHEDEDDFSSSNEHETNSVNVPLNSRLRPHRRQRRKQKSESETQEDGVVSPGKSSSKSCNGVSSFGGSNFGSSYTQESSATSVTTPQRTWAQLHMMEVAFSSQDNNLLHVTERFLNYGNMYPIIYRCHLRHLHVANEQVLLDSPSTGLQRSRFWSCRLCGKAHDVVRASCERCQRYAGPYRELVLDQLLPEPDYARSVLRLLHATHPEVTIHRIVTHPNVSGRGRSSVSVYVSADAAPELVTKLNGNVFFDFEDDDAATTGGGVRVHYVYSSQRPWLEAFINARRAQYGQSEELPWGALVVLMDASNDKKKGPGASSPMATAPRRKRKKSLTLAQNGA